MDQEAAKILFLKGTGQRHICELALRCRRCLEVYLLQSSSGVGFVSRCVLRG